MGGTKKGTGAPLKKTRGSDRRVSELPTFCQTVVPRNEGSGAGRGDWGLRGSKAQEVGGRQRPRRTGRREGE